MKTFANIIKTRAEWEAWKNSNNYANNKADGLGLVLIVENTRDIYAQYEALADWCYKAFKKYGGLDLDRLAGCGMLKSITRAARVWNNSHGGGFMGMVEDRAARVLLAADIWGECFN